MEQQVVKVSASSRAKEHVRTIRRSANTPAVPPSDIGPISHQDPFQSPDAESLERFSRDMETFRAHVKETGNDHMLEGVNLALSYLNDVPFTHQTAEDLDERYTKASYALLEKRDAATTKKEKVRLNTKAEGVNLVRLKLRQEHYILGRNHYEIHRQAVDTLREHGVQNLRDTLTQLADGKQVDVDRAMDTLDVVAGTADRASSVLATLQREDLESPPHAGWTNGKGDYELSDGTPLDDERATGTLKRLLEEIDGERTDAALRKPDAERLSTENDYIADTTDILRHNRHDIEACTTWLLGPPQKWGMVTATRDSERIVVPYSTKGAAEQAKRQQHNIHQVEVQPLWERNDGKLKP